MALSERLTAAHGALLVVDLQAKLLGKIDRRDEVVGNVVDLIAGAKLLGVPVWATEQYPAGLGPSVDEVVGAVPDRLAKLAFHAGQAPGLLDGLHARGVRHVTLAGIEAHVCVAQTALELMHLGFLVQIAADAVGSRHAADRETALRRVAGAGATVSTTEAVLFEWAERADRPEFKALSALIKARDARLAGPHSTT